MSLISFFPEFNLSEEESVNKSENFYESFLDNNFHDDPNNNNFEVDVKKTKGEFIFMLDCSGSMFGEKIEKAKSILKEFIA